MELERYEQDIRQLVSEGMSHSSISRYLRQLDPTHRGLSERSVRRFCARREIHYRSRLSDRDLDARVHSAVRSIGHSYGRHTLHGFLRSQGLHVSQCRIGRSLSRIAPRPAQLRRSRTFQQMNPVPYRADYYGKNFIWTKMKKWSCMA